MEQPPAFPSPQERRSLPVDRSKPYLLQRWNEGIGRSKPRWREVVAQGSPPSSAPVQRFGGALRQQTGQPHQFNQAGGASLYAPEEARQRPLPPPQAARVLRSQAPARRPWQQTSLRRRCASDEAIAHASHVVPAVGTLVRDRPGVAQVEPWLAEVEHGGIPALRAFAEGLKKDEDAVLAGLPLEWSHGPTEGFVNKLKWLTRTMYGRASFPLLRQRVLS